MPETADARRVLREMRDELDALRADGMGEWSEYSTNRGRSVALAFALSQVWIPQDVAEAALLLVERRIVGEMAMKEALTFNGYAEPAKDRIRREQWQALADALGAK